MKIPDEASPLTHGLVWAVVAGTATGLGVVFQGGVGWSDGLLIGGGFAVLGFIAGYLRVYL